MVGILSLAVRNPVALLAGRRHASLLQVYLFLGAYPVNPFSRVRHVVYEDSVTVKSPSSCTNRAGLMQVVIAVAVGSGLAMRAAQCSSAASLQKDRATLRMEAYSSGTSRGYTCTYEPSPSDNFLLRDVDLDLASFGFMVEFEHDDGELVLLLGIDHDTRQQFAVALLPLRSRAERHIVAI
ncbi:hypothetical protein BDZ89DRAFT_1215260 [Hymenopellis radicata]|nr:hypothetical protein BDZ89DRAFT_1215260 [Hymenopellis radicata]